MPRIPPELCARCKGYKRLCGLPACPILESFRAQLRATLKVEGREVEGATPPGVLVGERGYPRVSVYLMIPPGVRGEEARLYEDPPGWRAKGLPLSRIISLRASTLAGRLRADVGDPFRLYETEVGLAVLSSRPVDLEAVLSRPPVPRLRFHGITKPLGPTAPVESVRVDSSPRLERPVERAVWEDAPTADMVWELYTRGVDVYTVQRLLSMGFLGRLKRRRLVPTRWSITAVDEMLSRRLREELRGAESIGEMELYVGEYLGNRFIILLTPGPGTFEWVEIWHPHTVWTRHSREPIVYTLRENPRGEKTGEDGGYSAAKLPVLEHLYNRRRTADVLIVREILPSYYAPVGNWHIRETVRDALARGPVARPGSLHEARRAIEHLLYSDPGLVWRRSLLLGNRRQRSLSDYGLT